MQEPESIGAVSDSANIHACATKDLRRANKTRIEANSLHASPNTVPAAGDVSITVPDKQDKISAPE